MVDLHSQSASPAQFQGSDAASASVSARSPATSSAPTPAAIPGASQQPYRRRRQPAVVTRTACTECRKKRSKCDGQRPCARCKKHHHVECVYEVPVKQSKQNLRTEIETLRHHRRSSNRVLAALSQGDSWEEIVNKLRRGHGVEAVSEWLENTAPRGADSESAAPSSSQGLPHRVQDSHSSLPMLRGETGHEPGKNEPLGYCYYYSNPGQSGSHADITTWAAPQTRVESSRARSLPQDNQQFGTSPPHHHHEVDQALSSATTSSSNNNVPASAWTNVTADSGLVEHLLALYFSWEYPAFASLSKEHFLCDFREGSSKFCSPMLVNSLLALGCRFSNAPNTRADPDDPDSSGDHFFRESLRLFNAEQNNQHSLTTIQALGVMSIREASCGRDSESWFYAGQSIRLAVEMGLHRTRSDGDEDEVAVKSATFWGAFALDHAWSLATGSLPHCSWFPFLPPKPAVIDDIEASLWIPYTDDGVPLQQSCEQPSNVGLVYRCFCELSELVNQSLYVLHSPSQPLSSRNLLNVYTQYLNWYDGIPEALRLGHNFTPAVLFAHMYYHFAILLLFRPLIKLRIIGSLISPRDVCIQAADAIQGLLRCYSKLYTLRRTPSFVPYFVLTSSIMHLAVAAAPASCSAEKLSTGMSPPAAESPATVSSHQPKLPSPGHKAAVNMDYRVSRSIHQGIADLTEMAPCHHFAEQALSILKYLANEWHVDVDIRLGEPQQHEPRLRPHTSSLNFFAPTVTEEAFSCVWGGVDGASVAGGAGGQATASTENPLFWTFAFQGRAILPSGRMLREAGFEVI